MKTPRKIILWSIAVVVAVAVGRWTGHPEPQTYADCVLQHVRPGLSNVAAIRVCEACAEKFPQHMFAMRVRQRHPDIPETASDRDVIAYEEYLNAPVDSLGLRNGPAPDFGFVPDKDPFADLAWRPRGAVPVPTKDELDRYRVDTTGETP